MVIIIIGVNEREKEAVFTEHQLIFTVSTIHTWQVLNPV